MIHVSPAWWRRNEGMRITNAVLTPDEQAIARLISSKAGYCVSFDRISVYMLDSTCKDRQYAVNLEDHDGKECDEKCFKAAAEAAAFFETHRRRLRLGFDFEGKDKEKMS